jgi:hypothetical protein
MGQWLGEITMLLIDNVELTNEQKDFLEFVIGLDFPWYYQIALHDDGPGQFAHCMMFRDESNKPVSGKINSPHYWIAQSIVTDFCKKHDIPVNTILRAAVNCTWTHKAKDVGIHKDHYFEHNNFILYVNDCTSGDTIIYNDDETENTRITPEKYKAVIFDGRKHSHEFCQGDTERRIVMVFTFI